MPKKAIKSDKKAPPGVMDGIADYIMRSINNADVAAAKARVEKLRQAYPEADVAALVENLIRQKCFKTGVIGAVTSGASILPGLGAIAPLIFGVAADIGMTFNLQVELVLEIAAVYGHTLGETEKRNIIMVITGISAGVNQLLGKAGKEIAEKVAEELAQKAVAKAIPVFGIAASAGANALTTYIIGQRAQAYFGLGPAEMLDWAECIRALAGIDERKIIEWLSEAVEESWNLISQGGHNIAGAVITVGGATGEIIATQIEKTKEAAAVAGQNIAGGAKAAKENIAEAGQKAGQGIAAGGKKMGEGIAAGAGKVGEVATVAGKSVAGGAAATVDAVAGAGKKAGEGIARSIRKVKEKVTNTTGKLKPPKGKKKKKPASDAAEDAPVV